ncbi:hypothetical protein AcW1_009473 [Taiwanofungus camphoratus]|nr:hypothetical protein AcV7_006936 [Antrodia cinnamomea]KAI0947806.1 hypothetical protein AcW1_009473 [Antrodia cinnamomea]
MHCAFGSNKGHKSCIASRPLAGRRCGSCPALQTPPVEDPRTHLSARLEPCALVSDNERKEVRPKEAREEPPRRQPSSPSPYAKPPPPLAVSDASSVTPGRPARTIIDS